MSNDFKDGDRLYRVIIHEPIEEKGGSIKLKRYEFSRNMFNNRSLNLIDLDNPDNSPILYGIRGNDRVSTTENPFRFYTLNGNKRLSTSEKEAYKLAIEKLQDRLNHAKLTVLGCQRSLDVVKERYEELRGLED